jgi:hypothetical protein
VLTEQLTERPAIVKMGDQLIDPYRSVGATPFDSYVPLGCSPVCRV